MQMATRSGHLSKCSETMSSRPRDGDVCDRFTGAPSPLLRYRSLQLQSRSHLSRPTLQVAAQITTSFCCSASCHTHWGVFPAMKWLGVPGGIFGHGRCGEVIMPPPLRHYRFSGRLNQKKNPAVWVAASNDRSNLQGLAIGLRPILIGSRGSSSKVASAVTNAEPLMEGTMRPWSRRTVASNRLPMMLSCRQVCPGPKRPSATRHATLAEVPVPQGERS